VLLYRQHVASGPFETGAQFRYLGTTVSDQKLIREKLRGDRISIALTAVRPRNTCLLKELRLLGC
jgi:hypothetical protein